MTAVRRFLDRLPAWFGGDGAAPARWVVVDTETSGLDPERDALLAIGAVAVDESGIVPADSFEVVLQHDAAGDATNVAIHGIGYEAQRAGVPAQQALPAFAAWVADAPCIGFHTAFDRRVLERACAGASVAALPDRWLDLAELAAALHPEQHNRGARSLDDWLARYAIDTHARHSASGDAYVTAELLLRLRALAGKQGARGFAALAKMSRQHRWLGTS